MKDTRSDKIDYELIVMLILLVVLSLVDKSSILKFENVAISDIVKENMKIVEDSNTINSEIRVDLGVIYIADMYIKPDSSVQLRLIPTKYSSENKLRYIDGDKKYKIYTKNTILDGTSVSSIDTGYYRYYTMVSEDDKKLLILLDSISEKDIPKVKLSLSLDELSNYTNLKVVKVN